MASFGHLCIYAIRALATHLCRLAEPSVLAHVISNRISLACSNITEFHIWLFFIEKTKTPSPRSKAAMKPNFRQRKSRKTGLSTIELQKRFPELLDDSSEPDRSNNKTG